MEIKTSTCLKSNEKKDFKNVLQNMQKGNT